MCLIIKMALWRKNEGVTNLGFVLFTAQRSGGFDGAGP
jgi:hypothetical protein